MGAGLSVVLQFSKFGRIQGLITGWAEDKGGFMCHDSFKKPNKAHAKVSIMPASRTQLEAIRKQIW